MGLNTAGHTLIITTQTEVHMWGYFLTKHKHHSTALVFPWVFNSTLWSALCKSCTYNQEACDKVFIQNRTLLDTWWELCEKKTVWNGFTQVLSSNTHASLQQLTCNDCYINLCISRVRTQAVLLLSFIKCAAQKQKQTNKIKLF